MKTVAFLANVAIIKALGTDSEIWEAVCRAKYAQIDEGNFTEAEQNDMVEKLEPLCGQYRLGNSAEFHVGNLESYGCWCRFEADTHGKGRGGAVDIYDGFCKLYHDAVTCLAMDYGAQCNPWEVTYSFSVLSDDKTVDCESLNNNDCAINLCKIESHLVYNVLNEVTGLYGTPLQHAKYNKNHNAFDSSVWNYDECKVSGNGNGGSELECCGQYHIRYPFKTNGQQASKQCCDKDNGDFGTSTYNPVNNECCDGNIMPIGTNC